MAIIDFDSHLRDGWLLEEIYRCPSLSPNTRPGGAAPANIFTPGSSMTSLDRISGRQRQLQKTGARMGEFVNRKGIYPPPPDADKIKAVEVDDFDAQTFKNKTQEYHKSFLQ